MQTILIVDDVAANRRVLGAVLRAGGYGVVEAADARGALAAVEGRPPDLVITDTVLPGIDGYAFVRRLRGNPESAGVPVVYFTAPYGEREARARVDADERSSILLKPADGAAVLAEVRRALTPDAAAPPAARPAPALPREFLRLWAEGLPPDARHLANANARLRALINIGLELASERDPARLLQQVCLAVRDLFAASYVTLGIVDLERRTLSALETCGLDQPAAWIRTGDPVPAVFATVMGTRRPLRVGTQDAVRPQFPKGHPDVHAFVATPVASPGQVFGWLCMVGNDGRPFSEEDEQLVTALAGQLGRIYENGHFRALAESRAVALEQEVAERERAELALRVERDRARQALDTADVILLALDVGGRITSINRKGREVLGWEEADLLGRDFIDTCMPARRNAELHERLLEVIDGDLSIVEAPVATKAGEERLIEWRNTLLRDAGGAIVGTFSSGTDITERSRSIEALRAAEERMRFALESANVGIWDMDYGTGVLQWSPILEAQYGFAPATFGRTFEAFMARVHPADRDALLETMGRAARGGTDFSTHHRTVWPDGTVRWVTGAGRIQLDAAGRPMRGVGISFDVTERHTLEAQFQQAQKMEAIGRLAGGVAHDFNNLLTAILGYCELLLNDLDPADAHVPDILEIQKAGVSATALTRQLLAFSRKEPIQAEVLDLNHIITSMRLLLQRLLGEDVRVVLALAPGLARVSSDRGQLEQVVMNLAVNARDAMPSGGAVTIRTANVQLDAAYAAAHVGVNPGPHVALTISDSGTGMSAEVQSHLFEPFFTTKAPGHGTGLGLPTVAGIVARSGGTVTVASELGVGTAFTILLPAIDAPLVAVAVPAVPAAIAAPAERILVVEDEEGLRALTRRLLERLGYGVEEAACAEDALRLFDAYPPIDVVLSDVVMPGASGPELARQLVARQPNLRVVFMSGYTEETIARHGVTGPDVIFLQKPFTTGQLGQVIRTALDGVRS